MLPGDTPEFSIFHTQNSTPQVIYFTSFHQLLLVMVPMHDMKKLPSKKKRSDAEDQACQNQLQLILDLERFIDENYKNL